MKMSERQGKRFMLPRGTDVLLRQLRVVIEGVVAACIICAAEKTVFSCIDLPFLNPAAEANCWWMGVAGNAVNNWNPWILMNILNVCALMVKDNDKRELIRTHAYCY